MLPYNYVMVKQHHIYPKLFPPFHKGTAVLYSRVNSIIAYILLKVKVYLYFGENITLHERHWEKVGTVVAAAIFTIY